MDEELKITRNKVIRAAQISNEGAQILRELFPEAFERERTYYKGQCFRYKSSRYIIAITEYRKACLICLETGEKLAGSFHTIVGDPKNITRLEFERMIGDRELIEFELIQVNYVSKKL